MRFVWKKEWFATRVGLRTCRLILTRRIIRNPRQWILFGLASGRLSGARYPTIITLPPFFLFFFSTPTSSSPSKLRDNVTCPRWLTPLLNPSRHNSLIDQSAAVMQRLKLAIVQSERPTSNRYVPRPPNAISTRLIIPPSPARADRHKAPDRPRLHPRPGSRTPTPPRQDS